jgi:hypothetical protein
LGKILLLICVKLRKYFACIQRLNKVVFDSGKPLKSGRFKPEWVAGFVRNTRQVKSGTGGRIHPDFPTN